MMFYNSFHFGFHLGKPSVGDEFLKKPFTTGFRFWRDEAVMILKTMGFNFLETLGMWIWRDDRLQQGR